MRHNTPTPLEVEGADDDPTTRVWTEIEVIDPLDRSLVPIIVRTSQDFETDDDDTDPISDILQPANESVKDGASSDIADQQDDPQSQQETLPSQAEDHSRSIPVPVVSDLPGKRPRDDPFT